MAKKIFIYFFSCCLLFILFLLFRFFYTYHVDRLRSDYINEFKRLDSVESVEKIMIYENRGFVTIRLGNNRKIHFTFEQHRNDLDYLLNRKPVFYQEHDDDYRVFIDSIDEFSTGCDVELLHEKGAEYGLEFGDNPTIFNLIEFSDNIYELFGDWIADSKNNCLVMPRPSSNSL